MKFQSIIHLLVSHYEPAITEIETPRYSSVVLNYEIHVGRKSSNGHFVDLSYDGKYKGTLELSDRTILNLDQFTIEGLENVQNLQNDEFMTWALDVTNKKIILL